MLDQFNESILKNIVQVCTFLKAILKNKDEKILSLSLGIISALLSGLLFFPFHNLKIITQF